MNALVLTFLAALEVAIASQGGGVIVKGPSGVVTGHGPIGPTGPAQGDDGFYYGAFGGFRGAYPGSGHGGVTVIGPAAPHAVVAGPSSGGAYVAGPWAGFGYGGYGGYGGWGGYAGDGYAGYGGHGVAVRGPKTVPATIEGPAGKVVAFGLYGVPYHHY